VQSATKLSGKIRLTLLFALILSFASWSSAKSRSTTSAGSREASQILVPDGTDNIFTDENYCRENDCNTFDPSDTVDVDQDAFTANLPIVNDLGIDLPTTDIPCDPLDETCAQQSTDGPGGPPQCNWWGPAYNCTPPAWALDGSADLSAFLETCILNAREGQVVGLSAGIWRIDHQVWIRKSVYLTTIWAHGHPVPCLWPNGPACAELRASPFLNEDGGAITLEHPCIGIDHIVFNGNRGGRVGSPAWNACSGGDIARRRGFTAKATGCDGCLVQKSAFINTVCGAGMEFGGSYALFDTNSIMYNGDARLVSDGFSVTGRYNRVWSNLIRNNTDVAFISFNGPSLWVENNQLDQNNPANPVYAGIAIGGVTGIDEPGANWGVYKNALIRGNRLYCGDGANRNCHFGIQVGSHPFSLTSGSGRPIRQSLGGTIISNVVAYARQGMNVEGGGSLTGYFDVPCDYASSECRARIYGNTVYGSHPGSWNGFLRPGGGNCAHATTDYNNFHSDVCFSTQGCDTNRPEYWSAGTWDLCY